MIQIIYDDLFNAMFSVGGHDVKSFLNLKTGEVKMIHEDVEDAKETKANVKAHPKRYLEIPELGSTESFEFMEEFIQKIESPEVAEILRKALNQRKPFRRFKDALSDFPKECDAWYGFEEECQLKWAKQWIETEEIEAELVFAVF